jgi:hypothetical protein
MFVPQLDNFCVDEKPCRHEFQVRQGLQYVENLTCGPASEQCDTCSRQSSTAIFFCPSSLIFLYFSLFHLCCILIYHNPWHV